MPRKSKVPFDQICDAIISETSTLDADGCYPGPTQPAWAKVAAVLNKNVTSGGELTASYLYTVVHNNRHGIQDALYRSRGLTASQFKNHRVAVDLDTSSAEESQNESGPATTNRAKRPDKSFSIKLTSTQWSKMKPVLKPAKSLGRKDSLVFPAGSYEDIIVEANWDQNKIPCPFAFKHSYVYTGPSATLYAKFDAYCPDPDCGATATGRILAQPREGEPVIIDWRAPDTSGIPHSKRRNLSGPRRDEVGGNVAYSSVTSYAERKASRSMSQGDVAPPTQYTTTVLRKAKQQKRDKDLDIPHGCQPVINLTQMKNAMPYAGSIHELSMSKFHVHYYSPSQLLMYKQYCNSEYPVLIVDATGKLVRRLRTPAGESAHIFLYLGVIKYEDTTLPVLQMLSEKQDTSTIVYWINEWQRNGAPTPREVWIDNSPALKSAFARTLCRCADLAEYKQKCLDSLIDEGNVPSCFLRLDVAHYISRAAKWKVWQHKSTARLKQFYLRCLGLLIKCATLQEVREHLQAVTLLASSPHSAEPGRSFLVDRMKGNECELNSYINEDLEDDPFYLEEEQEETCSSVKELISLIKEENEAHISADTSTEFNAYYAPEVASKFFEAANDFVLWSGVMVRKFRSPHENAATAPVEAAIGRLKSTTMEGSRVLLRADKFVALHLSSIDGACKLAGADVLAKISRTSQQKQNDSGKATEETGGRSRTDASRQNQGKRKRPQSGSDNEGDSDALGGESEHGDSLVSSGNESQDEEEGPFDLSNQENWMNQAQPKLPKRKVRSKYLDKCPQMEALTAAEKLKPPHKQLLANGNIVGYVVTANSTRVQIKNTCGFDSLAQILAEGYLNYPTYRSILNSSENKLLLTAKNLAVEGAVTKTYKLRCEALTAVLDPQSALPKFSARTRRHSLLGLTYDCLADVLELFPRLLNDVPSVVIQNKCECSHQGIQNISMIEAHLEVLGQGITQLQQAVCMNLDLNDEGFHDGKCGYPCEESAVATVTFGVHLVINTDIYSGPQNIENSGRSVHTSSVNLSEVPTLLKLQSQNFLLVGVVHRCGPHLIAYTRSSDGVWRHFDDLSRKPITVEETKVDVSPVVVLYVRL